VPVDSPDDLYGLPLDRFVPERAALVKALRGDGQRDAAAAVAALRKPSVAAWAVNQLVRTQPRAIGELFQAGDELARAQELAVAGAQAGDAMRDAASRQRDALETLVKLAEGLLGSEGQELSTVTLERVAETLRAAAIDPAARAQVEPGCLIREVGFAGLGLGGLSGQGGVAPPVETPRSRRPDPQAEDAEHEDGELEARNGDHEAQARERAARAREREARDRERQAALTAARHAEAKARHAAARATEELAKARHRRDEAASALAEAARLLEEAEGHARQTADELRSAEATLEALGETET
jgi:hypothetical protein